MATPAANTLHRNSPRLQNNSVAHQNDNKKIQNKKLGVSTVMVATDNIAAAAKINPSYSLGGANVHRQYLALCKYASPDAISISSAVFVWLTSVSNRHIHIHIFSMIC